MKVEICSTAEDAGAKAANLIAARVRSAIAERGKATLALSGGRTPAVMMRELAAKKLPWLQIHIFQVDERMVTQEDPRRNLNWITAAFAATPIPPENIHAMPADSNAPHTATTLYYEELCANSGAPPQLDVVHLGLGEDGHTASLFPGDSGLETGDAVLITKMHEGARRMTLNLNVLDHARSRIWLVTGASKCAVARRLLIGDASLVASRVRPDASTIVLDRDAAGE